MPPRFGPQPPEEIERRRQAMLASFARRRALGLVGRRLPDDQSYEADGSRRIPLTKGLVAIVDAADYELVSRYKWHSRKAGRTHYAARGVPVLEAGGPYDMHRLIIAPPEEFEIDHIDGNGLNNRRANLRLCGRSENMWNIGPMPGRRFKGVCRVKKNKAWRADISAYCVSTCLGLFHSEVEAARAYDEAARRLHGPFARLNFPNEHPLPPLQTEDGERWTIQPAGNVPPSFDGGA